jgi:hypothetical protein
MLENNVKNNKKNSIPLRFEDNGGSKDAALISFILNIKKDFHYLSFPTYWHLFSSLLPAFPNSNFMSVLPKLTYGNMALIFLPHFHGYNKNEIFADYWDT